MDEGLQKEGGMRGVRSRECVLAHLLAKTNHPKAIVGTTMMTMLLKCFARYFSGRSTPMAKRPITRTTRMNSRVRMSVSLVQERGSTIFRT